MSKSKYSKPLVLIVIFVVAIPMALFFGMREEEGFLNFFPIDSMGVQAAFLMIMIAVSAIIGVLMGYVLAPVYLFIHKTFIGRGQKYGIDIRPKHEEKKIKKKHKKKFEYTFRGFFPALMAMNIGLLFVFNSSVTYFLISDAGTGTPIAVLFILLMITNGIAISLFSGAWFLIDAGLVYTNREQVRNKNEPIEIKSVGGWYMNILKGYSGIGIIFAFYSFIMTMFNLYGGELHISLYLFFVPLPILVAIWSLPAILIMDKTWKQRKKYILKFAKKLDIIEIIDIEIITP